MNTRSRIKRSGGAQDGQVQALPPAPSLGRSFGFLFTSAAVSRGVPFLVNVAVAHKLTPQEYGVPTVHFALVSTVVLTAREGVRRACLRGDLTHAEAVHSAWLALPVGLLAAGAVGVAATTSLAGGVGAATDTPYGQAVLCLCLAACVELCAEPWHVACARRGALRLRLAAETTATLMRAGATAALLLARVGNLPFELCFAAAQLLYACTLLLIYALGMRVALPDSSAAENDTLMLTPVGAWTAIRTLGSASKHATLLREFSAQAVWKLILAEGDKAVLLLAGASGDDTGTYGLASNLGALAVRLVLQPLEEAAYASFAAARRGVHTRQQLAALLRGLVLMGAWCAAIGPSFAFVAVRVVYGPVWASTPWTVPTVAAYALLLPILALNGVLEAWTSSTMTTSQVRASNAVLLASAVTQATVSVLGLRYLHIGPVALVAGNAAGMALRIAAATRYISLAASGKHRPTILRDALPHASTLAVIAACSAACAAGDSALRATHSGHQFYTQSGLGRHLFLGAGCAAVAAASAAMLERETVAGVAAALRGGQRLK